MIIKYYFIIDWIKYQFSRPLLKIGYWLYPPEVTVTLLHRHCGSRVQALGKMFHWKTDGYQCLTCNCIVSREEIILS